MKTVISYKHLEGLPRSAEEERRPAVYTHKILFDKEFLSGNLAGIIVRDQSFSIVDAGTAQQYPAELENHELTTIEGARVRFINVRVVPTS